MNEELDHEENESEDFEQVLRPKGFIDFQGQDKIVENFHLLEMQF